MTKKTKFIGSNKLIKNHVVIKLTRLTEGNRRSEIRMHETMFCILALLSVISKPREALRQSYLLEINARNLDRRTEEYCGSGSDVRENK